jgi:hypothetical protein
MKILAIIWEELIGMFIDDGALALFALALIAAVSVAIKFLDLDPLVGGGLLVAGYLAILAESVHRFAAKNKVS